MRVPFLAASVAFALLASNALVLSGCGHAAPEPAATPATAMEAIAPASPASVSDDHGAESTSAGTGTPAPSPASGSTDRQPTSAATATQTPTPAETATPVPADTARPAPANTPTPSPAGAETPAATDTPVAATPGADVARPPGRGGTLARQPSPAQGAGAPAEGQTPVDGSSSSTARSGTSSAPSAALPYTWQDGEHTRRVWLRPGLVLQETTSNTAEDRVIGEVGKQSIVERQARHDGSDAMPVFRNDSGTLMTLPGGVILVLDPDWGNAQVKAFFASNAIKMARVEAQDFTANAFFITTESGLPSLELANALADETGVLISSPNWRSQVALR